MSSEGRVELEEFVAPELQKEETIQAAVPEAFSTGIPMSVGSKLAVVVTDRRVFFAERMITGTLRPLRAVSRDDISVATRPPRSLLLAFTASVKLRLPDTTVSFGNRRYRSEMRELLGALT
jgi:hypothetical protein